MRALWLVPLFWLAMAAPAQAGPLAGVVAAISAAVKASALLGIGLRIVGSIGLNLIQQRRAKKARKSREPGLQVSATTRGGTESESMVIGRYATKGHLIYHNSHGKNNKFYQVVIELGGLPGVTLERVAIDGAWSDLHDTLHPQYGQPILAKREGLVDHAWVRFYDGTQVQADPDLVAQYSGRETIPWTTDHIGTGIPYAIVTMKVSSNVFPNGAADLRFELQAGRLYDPRKDSSVGGTGGQRWDDPATWAASRNPVVMIYNIMRGIRITPEWIWGGDAEAEDLPLASWVPAMDRCDLDIGGRPQFEAGLEIRFADDEPQEVLEDLLAACNGQIAEFGGFFYVQVGAPALPVTAIGDDDLLVSDDATRDPFPELLEIYNRVTTVHVSPGSIWNAAQIDMVRNAKWEAEDGVPRTFALELPAVFSAAQAAQIAEDVLRDNRRWRRHAWPLPPDYANLRPLDAVLVDSAWNGYEAKLFEVTEVVLDLHRLTSLVSLRERDPEDFTVNPDLEIPDLPPLLPVAPPDDFGLPDFDAQPVTWSNEDGSIRRPAILVSWDGPGIADTVAGIVIECQVQATAEVIWTGTTQDVERGAHLIQPVPPATDLRARARPLARNRATFWTPWVFVTSGDLRITAAEIVDEFNARVNTAFTRHDKILGEDGIPASVADLLNHIRAGLGPGLLPNLPVIPDVPGLPIIPPPPEGPVDLRMERVERQIDIEMPRNAARDEALDTLSEAVTTSLLKAARLESLIADAGVFVEPETGRVRIEASGFSGEAQIVVDGLNAAISQRTTFADVDAAIALANFDPSQIADLENVFLRLSTVESIADAQQGTLTNLSETLTVDGGVVTMARVFQRFDSIEGEMVNKVDVTRVDDLQSQVNAVEQTVSGIDGARFSTLLTSSAVLRGEVEDQAAQTLASLLSDHNRAKADRGALALARQDMWARADATDASVAGLRTELGVTFEDARALIQQEANARATATGALAETVTQLSVEFQNQSGEISGVAAALDDTSARVDQTEAGLDVVSRTTRANTAGIGLVAEDAASADLRALLDDHATRQALRAGVAQARSDIWATVEEGRLAVAGARDEFTAALGETDARVTLTQQALATETQARAQSVLELEGKIGDAEGALVELNKVDVTSESALVKAHLGLSGRVGDAEGALVELNKVDVTSESALVKAHLGLSGRVGDAEGALVELNKVDVTSESALVRAHLNLSGDVGEAQGAINDIKRLDIEPDSALAVMRRLQEVSLGNPVNLIPNGAFKGGDDVGWVLAPTMSVVARDATPGSPTEISPAAWLLRIDADAVDRFAVAVEGAEVQPGDVVDASLTAWVGAGAETISLQYLWRDAAGGLLQVMASDVLAKAGEITPLAASEAAPAGAATLDIRLRRLAGGTDPVFVTQVVAERQNLAARKIAASVDTIETTKVDANGAVAAVNQRISAEYGSLEAMAEATAFAKATADGAASGFAWRANGQGLFEAYAIADGANAPATFFEIGAQYVRITGLAQMDSAVIAQLAADTGFIGNLTVDTLNIAGEAVTTEKLAANGVTDFALAGSAAVVNDSTLWTTAAEFTISANAPAQSLLGTIVFTLGAPPESFPVSMQVRVTLNATTTVLLVTRDEIIAATGGGQRFVGSLSRAFTGSTATVKLQIRNAGGGGLSSSNIWGMLVKR
jgi:hypothetical protein